MAKILFVATQDWLFAQRHLPAVRAACELDLSVVVAARVQKHRRVIEAAGARLLDLDTETGGVRPLAMWARVARLRAKVSEENPDIVQFHGMKPLLAGAIAARLAGVGKRVFVLSGLGAVGRTDDVMGTGSLFLARNLLMPLAGEGAHLVFDNPDDVTLLGFDSHDEALPGHVRIHVLPGCGVDPLIHSADPMPWLPPLKLVFGSPLL
ncbi:MAG: glycosyltransferase, partial [Bosea sp. (in: a-proteobacteria)]